MRMLDFGYVEFLAIASPAFQGHGFNMGRRPGMDCRGPEPMDDVGLSYPCDLGCESLQPKSNYAD